MMSGILGASFVAEQLETYEQAFSARLRETVAEEMKAMQAETVALIPQHTGKLKRVVASADAIREERAKDGGWRFRFGLLTKELQRDGYYWLWVEFGRKAYQKGDERRAGKDKRGRERTQRIRRTVGAVRPQPSIRPAFISLRNRMMRQRALAKIHAAAMTACGR